MKKKLEKVLEMAGLPREKTIKKRNNIIKASTENNKPLSTNALKLYNFIYLAFQYNRDILEKYNYTISVKQTTLKQELNIKDKNYTEIITKAFEELIGTKVKISNFTNTNGEVVRTHITTLVNSISDYTSEEDNKTKCFYVRIDKELFNEMMKRKAGYTDLLLSNIKPLRSTHQIRLYEYCKSYQAMTKSEVVGIDELNELFYTNFKHLSEIEKIINRSIKRINNDTDIKVSYKKDKKNKTIQFFISSNSFDKNKRKYAKKKSEEEKNLIDKVLKKVEEKAGN